ncbi:MAG: hypothetical protein JOZ62_07995, partial [Acidobacteriaceae bacterium]|nr:hypothetical protein [Acidobacteriaceae bacterium]
RIAPTVGKIDLSTVTYCRIKNTMELVHMAVSENLVPTLHSNAHPVSQPFEARFDSSGDLVDFHLPAEVSHDAGDFLDASEAVSPGVRA